VAAWWGRRPLYDRKTALDWAAARLRPANPECDLMDAKAGSES
jgi:hypothetical protein